MKRLLGLTSLVFFSILAPAAHAQYAATQDSTLHGLKRVYLNFANPGNAIAQQQAEELANIFALELRKAGIRIAHDSSEFDPQQDAILNVGFIRTEYAVTNDLVLRIDLEQRATLQRTNQPLRMVTWFYEDLKHNVVARDVAPGMLMKGVNAFLSKWLDMNGR